MFHLFETYLPHFSESYPLLPILPVNPSWKLQNQMSASRLPSLAWVLYVPGFLKDQILLTSEGCRLPGGVHDIPAFWEFLRDQKDVQGEFAAPRFSAQGFYHPNLDRPGTAVGSSGFLLEEDPRLFDPSFFGIIDAEAETMDASQRKLLEVTYEAFENAGETWDSVSGSRIGVFVGDISLDNYVSQTRDWDYSGKYSASGAFPNMLANRIHYFSTSKARVC